MEAPVTNLTTILARHAADPLRRGQLAVSCAGEERTFAQLEERARRLAGGLRAAGLEPGDRIAVLMQNRIEWVELLFGIAAAGAVCVPVSILLRAGEIGYICGDSGATWIVADERSVDLLTELPEAVRTAIMVGAGDGPAGLEALAYESLIEAEPLAGDGPGRDDLAVIYYSSGTTGKPKGAAHTHAGVLWNAIGQVVDVRLTAADVYLLVPSVSWAAGFNNLFLALLWVGGRSAILPTDETSIDDTVTNLEAAGATHAMLVPTLVRQLLARPDLLERMRGTQLRWILCGGEPIARTMIDAWDEALPEIQLAQAYGMSEFPTLATILRPEYGRSHAGTAGQVTSQTEMAVRTDEGEIVRSGEGEVLLRSLAVMREYYGKPEETERVFADGWFASGDRGRIDEDGFLSITGRVKDMIISGGLNVYPREIEEVIYRLPDIVEACVVGVADEQWGEVPAAVIVSEKEDWDGAAVIAHCREHLASFKCPKHVIVRVDRLPRNPSGKVLKREVAPWAERYLETSKPQSAEVPNAH
ncbi:MAG TPA: AMP-binding protein [Solirubrobacterales bacterium]|nr:AMP-binding protein [Solirubrobacterales bacterium]